jgi:alkylhydroperoxidase family enzyme
MSHGSGASARRPRVREVHEHGDDPILKELFEKEQEAFGFVLNTTRVMAQRPGILRAAKQLGAAIDRSGLLPKDLVALVNLRVALINGCPF